MTDEEIKSLISAELEKFLSQRSEEKKPEEKKPEEKKPEGKKPEEKKPEEKKPEETRENLETQLKEIQEKLSNYYKAEGGEQIEIIANKVSVKNEVEKYLESGNSMTGRILNDYGIKENK